MNPKTIIPPQDAHFKKIVELRHQKNTLHFRVAQALFSSHQIDVGTVRLLRSLKKRAEMAEVHKVLDLGCGYGPLGLTLKSLVPQREVHLVDRDALALTYTLQNAALNQLQAVSVYGSLGYDDVNGRDFDLILSNIPGKVGAEAITHMVLDAKAYLRWLGRIGRRRAPSRMDSGIAPTTVHRSLVPRDARRICNLPLSFC